MQILLTGSTGSLASCLIPELEKIGHVTGVTRGLKGKSHFNNDILHFPCDLVDKSSVFDMIEAMKPDLVLHLAALTNVDHCEQNPYIAYQNHVLATENLCLALQQHRPDCYFLYTSTDQVYNAPRLNDESSVQPCNTYALTKLWAEEKALLLDNAAALRINFFLADAHKKTGLINWILTAGQGEKPAVLFSDVFFNPLHGRDIAKTILLFIEKRPTGVFNVGASGQGMSKADFIRMVARKIGIILNNFKDGSIYDVALPAMRPTDMRMDVSKTERTLRHKLPTLEQTLEHI